MSAKDPPFYPPLKNYNYFFHPNACHVCKWHVNVQLQPCYTCYMIFYCSEEHKLLHEPQHREICSAIINLNYNIWDSCDMKQEEWEKFRKDNVRRIEEKLCRELEPYERQMFLYPKSCLVCHHQINLPNKCPNCLSHTCSFSKCNHRSSQICAQRLRCFEMDRLLAIDDNRNKEIMVKILSSITKCMNEVDNMRSVIDMYIAKKSRSNLEDYEYTDLFSKPLTLFHGMERLRLLRYFKAGDTFVVHVITGCFTDKRDLSAWEIFPRKFGKEFAMTIVMVGPKLKNMNDGDTAVISKRFKLLQYQCVPMHYADYICSSLYKKPNMIVGFDAQLWKEEQIVNTIVEIKNQACPLLLTATSKSAANKNIANINSVLGRLPMLIINEENHFASLRPHRNYKNDFIFYRNSYLIMYKNLFHSSEL